MAYILLNYAIFLILNHPATSKIQTIRTPANNKKIQHQQIELN